MWARVVVAVLLSLDLAPALRICSDDEELDAGSARSIGRRRRLITFNKLGQADRLRRRDFLILNRRRCQRVR